MAGGREEIRQDLAGWEGEPHFPISFTLNMADLMQIINLPILVASLTSYAGAQAH